MQRKQENKKIKNATPLDYDGVHFKSKLEVMCYKTLKEFGFNPLYEQKRYRVFLGFVPHVPFYTKNVFTRKNKNIHIVSRSTVKDFRKISPWDYTPDFYLEYNNYIIFIECKGFYNDVARYKNKLFRWLLEGMQQNDNSHQYEYWEIHTKKQLLDCIKHIADE